MNPLYYLLLIPVIASFLVFQNVRQKRRVTRYLRSQFGQPPTKTYRDKLPSIRQYWQACAEHMEESNTMDDITWNDLDMDRYFESINTTYSSIGSETLYARLHRLSVSNVESMVARIQQDEDLRTQLAYYLYGIGKFDDNQVPELLFEPQKHKPIGYALWQSYLPLVGLALAVISIPAGVLLTLIAFVVNIVTRLRLRLVVEHGLLSIRYISKAILFGKKLVKLSSVALPDYARRLSEAIKPLEDLPSKGVPVIIDPTNPLFQLIDYANFMFLLDFKQYNRAIQMLIRHPGALYRLWETIGELEAAFVIASLDQRAAVTKPVFLAEHGIRATNLVHPLLTDPVANDVDFFKSILVSGSNASGKSTYVKAVALSAITAQNLNRVYATDWGMKPGCIITSMAIRDNLYQGDSYFVAEIKSLKRMIEATKGNQPVYLFIDEILKGTNTIERIAASHALLNYFHDQSALVIVATHDIELTELQEGRMTNHHFREIVREDEIVFDYQLKAGPTRTTNAINLLRYYDFPAVITQKAAALADHFGDNRTWR